MRHLLLAALAGAACFAALLSAAGQDSSGKPVDSARNASYIEKMCGADRSQCELAFMVTLPAEAVYCVSNDPARCDGYLGISFAHMDRLGRIKCIVRRDQAGWQAMHKRYLAQFDDGDRIGG